MRQIVRNMAVAAFAFLLVAAVAPAAKVCIDDPANDDNGPGGYVYPTDSVYINGSFDMTKFCFQVSGNRATVEVTVNSNLQDPWRMGNGFSVQMIFVYIQNNNKQGGGYTVGLPGTNHKFSPEHAWDRVIILSPQQIGRVQSEVEAKVSTDMQRAVIVPRRTKGSGRTISGSFATTDLGEPVGDAESWRYQVIMQSNEGFPAEGDLLTRKVNEFEGQHRFGGGTDYDCDPHVMDILGDQAAWLAYECEADGSPKSMATVEMVRQ